MGFHQFVAKFHGSFEWHLQIVSYTYVVRMSDAKNRVNRYINALPHRRISETQEMGCCKWKSSRAKKPLPRIRLFQFRMNWLHARTIQFGVSWSDTEQYNTATIRIHERRITTRRNGYHCYLYFWCYAGYMQLFYSFIYNYIIHWFNIWV